MREPGGEKLDSSLRSTWGRPVRMAALAALSIAMAMFSAAPAAFSEVTGEPSEFDLCPTSFAPLGGASLLCAHSETTGGQITIGSTSALIDNNPDTVDFGAFSTSGLGFVGPEVIVTPTNGEVFAGPAQVVPGGLIGITGVLGKLLSPLDPINGVTATVELAGPITPATVLDPTAVRYFFCATGAINSCFGSPSPSSAITVPIKIQLNNAVLGTNCFIGTNANPIVLNLVETPTSQPQLATGGPGGNTLIVTGAEVADNTFAVPGVTGCGTYGLFNSIINAKVGLPSPSGKNSVLIDEDAEVEEAEFVCEARGETAPCD